MTTIRLGAIIPAVTIAIVAAACSSEAKKESTEPSIDVSASTSVATGAPASTPIATDTAPATNPVVAGETVPLTDAPDSPDTNAPAPFDTFINAIVGIDTASDRVENVPLGAQVTLVVTNPDNPDEFHVHGYELGDGEPVEAGESTTFYFTADSAGEFVVESHVSDTVLLMLEVG